MSLSTGVSVFFLQALCIFTKFTPQRFKNALCFLAEFHIIVCGLDSIIARRWINGMLVGCRIIDLVHFILLLLLPACTVICAMLFVQISLLSYEDGVLDPSSIIPLIDGGTEGFKGNARVILPGMTACIDCTLELYPPQVSLSSSLTRLNAVNEVM